MPPAIPDRYSLEMRLGRDGDLEEWLATDLSLQRPVLLRSLGPESSEERRDQFVASVSSTATVSHSHLAMVYAAERVAGGAYSVSEWTGGATASDRVAAEQTIDLDEFLPNAAGLAGALAAVHETGAVHGHIDLSAISFSVAHPAKLGAFGRVPQTDAKGDVIALASAIETALTGLPPGGPPPSESLDGVSPVIDRILESGGSGKLTAAQLEEELLAAPTPRATRPQSRTSSRRLLVAAGALVVAAVGLVVIGRLLSGGGPILPQPSSATAPPEITTPAPSSTIPTLSVTVLTATSYDPFGEGGENDHLLPNIIDGDASTSWSTERYQEPMGRLKEGVGIRFRLSGTPEQLQLLGFSAGTEFEIRWSEQVDAAAAEWERIARAKAPPGAAVFNLPPRSEGVWLIWMTDVPEQDDNSYYAELAEVRFTP